MARTKLRKFSEEHKAKISAAQKGRPGRVQSEEEKAKRSATMQGRPGRVQSEEEKAKISESMKGRTLSEEHRIKMSIGRGGNGNLNRKYPGCSAWRRRNIERTPYCQFCFSEDNLEAHHIIPKSKFPQYHDEDWNCRILCNDCHKICHKQGAY